MSEENKTFLLHHEQHKLCTTRLPYRQGRKLTAVKVYTVNDESNHLLIFGVPSINLRQEMKSLFCKFGKLLLYDVTKTYASESFTNTYHAIYDNIQQARLAKKMLDTKNFYGGILHVCYAPELETYEETHMKLMLRQKNVLNRIHNIKKEKETLLSIKDHSETLIGDKYELNIKDNNEKINMGEVNIIELNKNKVKIKNVNKMEISEHEGYNVNLKDNKQISNEIDNLLNKIKKSDKVITKKFKANPDFRNNVETVNCTDNVEIVDFTSVNNEVLTNINEHLNYNRFGDEIVKKVPEKPINVIKYNK